MTWKSCTSPVKVVFLTMAVVTAPALAQSSSKQGADTSASHRKILEGCLTSLHGVYSLGTTTDGLYHLQGSAKMLSKHVSQQVRVTGLVEAPKSQPSAPPANGSAWHPPTLKVSKIEKVFDTCQ
jgi:hypothetical protein